MCCTIATCVASGCSLDPARAHRTEVKEECNDRQCECLLGVSCAVVNTGSSEDVCAALRISTLE